MSGRKLVLNALAAFVVAIGGASLASTPATAADEEPGCCYGTCMQYCMIKGQFSDCHTICNRDCEAC